MIHDKALLQRKFEQALSYTDYVKVGEREGHRPPWDDRYNLCQLTEQQHSLVAGFTRKMHVLSMSGTWCGDCALQGSAIARIAEANPDAIDLRFLQRSDEHADLIVKCGINAGWRVPVTWFLAEDFEPVAWFGDRTLSRYRSMARKALPPEETQALAAPPENPVRRVLEEMLDEFERVQLILRLSGRLRQKHGD